MPKKPNRTWWAICEEIRQILIEQGFASDIIRLKKKIDSGATGGECLSYAASGVLYLIELHPSLKAIIEMQVTELTELCEFYCFSPQACSF